MMYNTTTFQACFLQATNNLSILLDDRDTSDTWKKASELLTLTSQALKLAQELNEEIS